MKVDESLQSMVKEDFRKEFPIETNPGMYKQNPKYGSFEPKSLSYLVFWDRRFR